MKDKILDTVAEHCVGWKNCEALTEKLFDLYSVSQRSELLPSTCPSCGSYEWSYHLSIDKMKCLDCGNCG